MLVDALSELGYAAVALLGAGYILYWCYRAARHTWSALTGRPIVTRAPALSPGWTKAFHVAGTLASIALVVMAACVVLFLIVFSGAEF